MQSRKPSEAERAALLGRAQSIQALVEELQQAIANAFGPDHKINAQAEKLERHSFDMEHAFSDETLPVWSDEPELELEGPEATEILMSFHKTDHRWYHLHPTWAGREGVVTWRRDPAE